jgi:hypothetical protein
VSDYDRWLTSAPVDEPDCTGGCGNTEAKCECGYDPDQYADEGREEDE